MIAEEPAAPALQRRNTDCLGLSEITLGFLSRAESVGRKMIGDIEAL